MNLFVLLVINWTSKFLDAIPQPDKINHERPILDMNKHTIENPTASSNGPSSNVPTSPEKPNSIPTVEPTPVIELPTISTTTNSVEDPANNSTASNLQDPKNDPTASNRPPTMENVGPDLEQDNPTHSQESSIPQTESKNPEPPKTPADQPQQSNTTDSPEFDLSNPSDLKILLDTIQKLR